VQVGILGPLEVRDDAGNLLPVSGARLRALLIRLAIADGRAVSVDRLAEDLWDGQGPADAANAVQALVSRLRGTVGRDTVEFGPVGYRLMVGSDGVDARAFEQQVGAGRRALADGRWTEAASLLAEALGRWRGPALADVADAAFAASAITRLSELRLAAEHVQEQHQEHRRHQDHVEQLLRRVPDLHHVAPGDGQGLPQRLPRADPGSQLGARPLARHRDSHGVVSQLHSHAALPVCSSSSSCAG
jgi:DNA-binding SARP family transcriptional activator